MAYLRPASDCNCETCSGGQAAKGPLGETVYGGWICACPCHKGGKKPDMNKSQPNALSFEELKRFTFWFDDLGEEDGYIGEDDTGEYILHSEAKLIVDALRKEKDAAIREQIELSKDKDTLMSHCDLLKREKAELQEQLKASVAARRGQEGDPASMFYKVKRVGD